jgi:hypothetical protein
MDFFGSTVGFIGATACFIGATAVLGDVACKLVDGAAAALPLSAFFSNPPEFAGIWAAPVLTGGAVAAALPTTA